MHTHVHTQEEGLAGVQNLLDWFRLLVMNVALWYGSCCLGNKKLNKSCCLVIYVVY